MFAVGREGRITCDFFKHTWLEDKQVWFCVSYYNCITVICMGNYTHVN